MQHFYRARRPFYAILFSLFIAVPAVAAAETKSEHALFQRFDDPALAWGPCPEFLPDGCAIAVLQGDSAERNTDIFFKVPGGAGIPLHTHTSAERMILVSGELELRYAGQDVVVVRPGAYAYGPPELPHEGSCAAGDPCVLFIAFEEPVDAMPVEQRD
jgi:quercetin dioxygenase-like cupin family protein